MRQERAAAVPPEPGKGIQLKLRLLHGMVTRCFDRDGDFQVIFGAFFCNLFSVFARHFIEYDFGKIA